MRAELSREKQRQCKGPGADLLGVLWEVRGWSAESDEGGRLSSEGLAGPRYPIAVLPTLISRMLKGDYLQNVPARIIRFDSLDSSARWLCSPAPAVPVPHQLGERTRMTWYSAMSVTRKSAANPRLPDHGSICPWMACPLPPPLPLPAHHFLDSDSLSLSRYVRR